MSGNFFRWCFPVFLLAGCCSTLSYAAVVLQYHHVSHTTPPSTSITPELFEQHLDYLAEKNFNVVPLVDLVDLLKRGEPLPDKTVAITFDDGYESIYATAFPLLQKRRWPFTVFVSTKPHDDEKKLFLTWEQLREMAQAGVTIANHSTAHNHLLRLHKGETRAQWEERITHDLLDAEARIKTMIGQSHRLQAYPYGEYDNAVKLLLKKLGFVAFGQQSGPLFVGDDLQALPRFPFGGSYGALEDFAIKVNTLPFPVQSTTLYRDLTLTKPLVDLVLPPAQQPVLAVRLQDRSLLERVNCFASGQGAITVQVVDEQVVAQAKQPLRAGRTRYNCTAASATKGRFYWLSQQWLTTGERGVWLHED